MNLLTNYSLPNNNVKPLDSQAMVVEKNQVSVPQQKKTYKPDMFDKIADKVVNKRDAEDMVHVPRAIFKGYFCFTIGTSLNALGMLIKNEKIKKGLAIAGSLIAMFGTYNFVKPFFFREKN